MSTSVIYSPMSPPSLIYTDFGIAHTVSQLKAYLIWPPYNIVNKKDGGGGGGALFHSRQQKLNQKGGEKTFDFRSKGL